jgi:hypothetical protein
MPNTKIFIASKRKIKILLLEGLHNNASQLLTITIIQMLSSLSSLETEELIDKIKDAHLLG